MTAAEQSSRSGAIAHDSAPVQAALDGGGVGTWQWDTASDRLSWSPTLARIHGLSAALHGSIDDLERSIHEGDRACVLSALRGLLTRGASCTVRYRVDTGDGASRCIECTAAVADDRGGEATRVAGICLDLTDRICLEHELRLRARATELLASSMEGDATLQAVADSVIPEIADWCAVDLLRHGALQRGAVAISPEVDARVGRELAREFDIERMGPAIREVIDGKAPRLVEPPGGPTARSCLCVPLEARGTYLGAMTLALADPARTYGRFELDLVVQLARTDAVAIQRAREHAAAQDALNVQDEALAIVSHDLRNPLNTVQMAVSVLREELPGGAGRERLDAIDRAVKRANDLLRDLLDAAHVRSGKLGIERSPCSATRLLDDLEASATAQATVEHKRLVVSRPVPDGEVWADRQRILQVLSNLTSNAFQHAHTGVEVGAAQRADEWTFWVHDDGPGLTAEQLPHVFEPSWRARQVRKGGSGLGLAIARGLVEVHGGRMWVDTQVHSGARFCFTLPVGTRV